MGGTTIYAIIETGGKQYRVTPGMTIDVDRLEGAEEDIELSKVLIIADGENITQGAPLIEGARVVATSRGEGKARKVIVGKFKAKNRYARKNGHRQLYTRLVINHILRPGEAIPEKPSAKTELPAEQPETKPEVS